LTDSAGVWFLKGILRSHAYDEKSLQLLVGKQLSSSSWKIGDMVAPKKLKYSSGSDEIDSFGVDGAIGRIVHESPTSGSFPVRMRVSGSVNVVFVSKVFAESTSLATGSSFKEKPFALESRKVSTSRLVYTSKFHGLSVSQKSRKGTRLKTKVAEDNDEAMNTGDISDKVSSDFSRLTMLDVPAIERITKECDKTSTSLVALVEAGLPKFVLQALDHVMKNIQISENDESIAQAISSLGKLALRVAQKSFPDDCCVSIVTDQGNNQDKNQQLVASDDFVSNLASNENRSPLDPERSDENPDSSSEEQSGHISRSSSLMQRRRMFLSLMSRARRVGGDSLGDIISREMHILPSLELSADSSEALLLAPHNAAENFEDGGSRLGESRLENSRPSECTTAVEDKSAPQYSHEETLLDTVFRGRNNTQPIAGNSFSIPSASVKSIVSMGILGNSLPWLRSFLESFAKKVPRKNSSSEFPLLENVLDDDGMPLLQLAITFGCSKAIIEELIRYGAPVRKNEVELAADLDLPDILSVLLLHYLYSDDVIDLEKCSPAIAEVILDAKQRQDDQNKKLRIEASSFLVSFTQKLVQISLKRRQQQQQNGSDILGRTIACALVGNIELCALRMSRQRKPQGSSRQNKGAASDIHVAGMDPYGLLQVLPLSILGQCLSEEPSHLTNLLLLIEDFLCSKGINDGCVGLTLLLTLIQRFPPLKLSSEMERYGFAELVDSHAALSLNRLTEISSRVAKRNSNKNKTDDDIFSAPEVMFCPKKHTASLHVTRHSSFRCDLCGVGVKCGAIMHGCRKCDWDACEACTDKVEGGIMKWKFVRELSSRCQQLLSRDTILQEDSNTREEYRIWTTKMIEGLKQLDKTSDVNTLSIRLLQQDPDAIRGLADMLEEKGRITMHQFLMIILPALHSTLMGKSLSNDQSDSGRRTKKPRVAGIESRANGGSVDTRDVERLEFAQEILKTLVNNSSHVLDLADSLEEDQTDDFIQDVDGNVANDFGFRIHSEPKTKKNETLSGKNLPELLRRLHQVLALHEDVSTLSVLHYGHNNDISPGNLRSLKEPIKLRLRHIKSIATERQTMDQDSQHISIFCEPLVSIKDLSRQILKIASKTHPDYGEFCRKLVNESAIILERPFTSSESAWRIARIVSYDGKTGCHGVNYALNIASESNHQNDDPSLDLAIGDKFPRLNFETDVSKLILSARRFMIIHRERKSDKKSAFDMEQLLDEGIVEQSKDSISGNMVGTIVESNFESSSWGTYTVVGLNVSDKETEYDIVSEDGRVVCGVPANRLSGIHPKTNETAEVGGSANRLSQLNPAARSSTEAQGHFSRAYPFLMASTRQQVADEESPNSIRQGQEKQGNRSLKRSWSALALIESMSAVGVSAKPRFDKRTTLKPKATKFACSLGCKNITISVDENVLESPPRFEVNFSSPRSPSPINISTKTEKTLVSLIHKLHGGETFDFFRAEGHEIYYNLDFQPVTNEEQPSGMTKEKKNQMLNSKISLSNDAMDWELNQNDEPIHSSIWESEGQSLQLSHTTTFFDYDELGSRNAGLDEICVQCMEILEFLARVNAKFVIGKKENRSVFVNEDLSQMLTKHTEDPLFIVGGITPEWCLSIPSLFPNLYVFSILM